MKLSPGCTCRCRLAGPAYYPRHPKLAVKSKPGFPFCLVSLHTRTYCRKERFCNNPTQDVFSRGIVKLTHHALRQPNIWAANQCLNTRYGGMVPRKLVNLTRPKWVYIFNCRKVKKEIPV